MELCNASIHGESKQAPLAPPILQLRLFYLPDNSLPWDNQVWYVSSLWLYEAVNATTPVYQEAASNEGWDVEPNWFLKIIVNISLLYSTGAAGFCHIWSPTTWSFLFFTELQEKSGGMPKGLVLIFVWLKSISSAWGFAREQLRFSENIYESPAIRKGVEMRADRDSRAGLVEALGWLTGSRSLKQEADSRTEAKVLGKLYKLLWLAVLWNFGWATLCIITVISRVIISIIFSLLISVIKVLCAYLGIKPSGFLNCWSTGGFVKKKKKKIGGVFLYSV